jgi:hypothetical protein
MDGLSHDLRRNRSLSSSRRLKSTNSAEAEYVTAMARETIWLHRLITEVFGPLTTSPLLSTTVTQPLHSRRTAAIMLAPTRPFPSSLIGAQRE